MHWPLAGLVWQSATLTGRRTPPVSAEAVMRPLAPTFTVAIANTPTPLAPGIPTTPVLPMVAARATMSGTADSEADTSNVLIPVSVATGSVLVPAKR